MNIEFLKAFIRESWYLFVVVAVALAAAFYGFVTQDARTVKIPVPGTVATSDKLPRGLTQQQALEVMAARPEPPSPPTPQEKAKAVIVDHQKKIEEAPDSEAAPAYLNAIGNLSKDKLGDYEKAAQCYEQLLAKYPYWISIRGVYPKLAECYDKMGKADLKKDAWRRMMNRYPEGSPEYEIAKKELGLAGFEAPRPAGVRIQVTDDRNMPTGSGSPETTNETPETASGTPETASETPETAGGSQ